MKLWSHEGFKVCIRECPIKVGENLKKVSSQIKLARVKLKGLVTLEAGCLNPFRYLTHDFKSFLGRGVWMRRDRKSNERTSGHILTLFWPCCRVRALKVQNGPIQRENQ